MLKIFFPAVGVGFSELRQIAVTFCHSSVKCLANKNQGLKSVAFIAKIQACAVVLANEEDRHFRFGGGVQRRKNHRTFSIQSGNQGQPHRL